MGRLFRFVAIGIVIFLSFVSQALSVPSYNQTQVCNSTISTVTIVDYADGNRTQEFTPCVYGCDNSSGTCIVLQEKIDYGFLVIFAVLGYVALMLYFAKIMGSEDRSHLAFLYGALLAMVGIVMFLQLYTIPNDASTTIHQGLAESLPILSYLLVLYFALIVIGYLYELWEERVLVDATMKDGEQVKLEGLYDR